MIVESVLLLASAGMSCVLGMLVLFRNPLKVTHRLFAVLSANLSLWALGVLGIIHSHTMSYVTFWVYLSFMLASFLPATFYHFITYFPHQRFNGYRPMLYILYGGATLQVLSSLSPWYIKSIHLAPNTLPQVNYGPVFFLNAVWVLLSMLFSFSNLFYKLRLSTGVERRQVEHVLIAIVLTTTFMTATNILAPAMKIHNSETYGPVFTMLMMGMLAYAMVRYHLLDIWLLVSRTTVYAIVTAFIFAVFLGAVGLVQLVFSQGGTTGNLLTTLLAALVIALFLQPLKEHIQLIVQRTILKRQHDVYKLCAQITRKAGRFMHLDQLLDTVAGDIKSAMSVSTVRVWLTDPKEPRSLICHYSTIPEEMGARTDEHAALLDFLGRNPDPVILRKLLHQRPTQERIQIARHLAEMEAYLCLPLHAGSKLIGLLALDEKESGDIYSSDDITVFTTIAAPLGTAIENARLYVKIEEVNLHLARILSSMRGGVIAVDKAGKITTFNESAASIVGPMETGQDVSALRPEVAEVLRTTLQEERAIGDFEMTITNPAGDPVPVVISSSCLQIPQNGICGALAMIHDLTQVKRLEQNVQRADRLSSIGTLAAGMAHEVKNPLVSIKTFTQLLLNKYDDADFRSTFAEVVPHEVERIDTIVSRLLDFSRPKPVMFARQDLVRIIQQVFALLENQFRKNSIVISFDHPGDGVGIHGDEQQLHQMFLNLFLNAIDAMKEKRSGQLAVRIVYDRAHLRRKGEAPYLDTECARVLISDSGCGIERSNLEQLFTPFFTTKAEGCGLGLSVVHGIVTEHGGEIDVDSAPGAGTTFTVTLPLHKEALAELTMQAGNLGIG